MSHVPARHRKLVCGLCVFIYINLGSYPPLAKTDPGAASRSTVCSLQPTCGHQTAWFYHIIYLGLETLLTVGPYDQKVQWMLAMWIFLSKASVSREDSCWACECETRQSVSNSMKRLSFISTRLSSISSQQCLASQQVFIASDGTKAER